MEIHELNTFGGTLGANDYFATDNGSDTSKISAEDMMAPLNERIDNIIAGGTAPSAAEVTDARLGATVLGSVQYTSLGNAIRGQATALFDNLLNFGASFRKPLIPKANTSTEAKAISAAVIGMWFEFETDADEYAFWNGTHTYNGNTYDRNVGLAYVPTSTEMRFYWFNNTGSYIPGNRAFDIKSSDPVYYENGYSYHTKKTTLDGYSITIHAVVDWSNVAAYSNVFSARFSKELNKLYGDLFTLETEYKVPGPIKRSGSLNSSMADAVCNAIKGFYIEFSSSSTEAEFWAGNHTFNNVSYKRNVGPAVVELPSSNTKQVGFYWLDDDNHFIASDRAFEIRENSDALYKIGNIAFHRKDVTLDGYACIVYIAIEWDTLSFSSATAFNSYYDNSSLSYEKNLFAFSGVLSAGKNNGAVNFGVDGDSITAGNQWSYYVYEKLGYKTHHNVGVGSSQWQDEIIEYNGETYYPQIYGESGWLGMSDGWGEISDATEAQKRANNSSKNHVLKFIEEVNNGLYPAPDLFVFAFGTNDKSDRLGTVEAAFASPALPAVNDVLLRTTTGAMRWCIQKIKLEYPDCKVFWSTPIQSALDNRQSGNIIKIPVMTEVANLLSVEIIDQWKNSGISAFLEKASPHYLRDETHPTKAGIEAMGQYAVSVLSGFSGTII